MDSTASACLLSSLPWNNSYYFILVVPSVISLILMYLILKSPLALRFRAIRDNPQRCEAVGIHVRRHQLYAIVIATSCWNRRGSLCRVGTVRIS